MWTLIIIGLVGWFGYRHLAKKKRQRDIENWGVDFRAEPKLKFPARRDTGRNNK